MLFIYLIWIWQCCFEQLKNINDLFYMTMSIFGTHCRSLELKINQLIKMKKKEVWSYRTQHHMFTFRVSGMFSRTYRNSSVISSRFTGALYMQYHYAFSILSWNPWPTSWFSLIKLLLSLHKVNHSQIKLALIHTTWSKGSKGLLSP